MSAGEVCADGVWVAQERREEESRDRKSDFPRADETAQTSGRSAEGAKLPRQCRRTADGTPRWCRRTGGRDTGRTRNLFSPHDLKWVEVSNNQPEVVDVYKDISALASNVIIRL